MIKIFGWRILRVEVLQSVCKHGVLRSESWYAPADCEFCEAHFP